MKFRKELKRKIILIFKLMSKYKIDAPKFDKDSRELQNNIEKLDLELKENGFTLFYFFSMLK